MLSNQNDTHVSLMLFYCLKLHRGEEEVKHWQDLCIALWMAFYKRCLTLE